MLNARYYVQLGAMGGRHVRQLLFTILLDEVSFSRILIGSRTHGINAIKCCLYCVTNLPVLRLFYTIQIATYYVSFTP